MPEVAPPQPRDLQSEIGSILQLSGALTDQQSQAFLQNYRSMINQAGSTWMNWIGPGSQIIRDQQNLDRNALVNWMQTQGPAAQQALLASNPALNRALTGVDQLNTALQSNMPEISTLLNQQALDQLKLGGKLSPEEERYATQNAREAYAARGLSMSDAGALSEVLNRDTLSRQRLQQAQAFAGSRESIAGQFELSAAQLANQTTFGREILNMPTNALQVSAQINSVTGAAAAATPNFSNLAVGSLGYVGDLFNTNLNMQASMYNSQLNNQAALQAAQISADAQVAAARLQSQALAQSASLQAGAARSAGSSAITGSLIGAGGAIAGGVLIAF